MTNAFLTIPSVSVRKPIAEQFPELLDDAEELNFADHVSQLEEYGVRSDGRSMAHLAEH